MSKFNLLHLHSILIFEQCLQLLLYFFNKYVVNKYQQKISTKNNYYNCIVLKYIKYKLKICVDYQ